MFPILVMLIVLGGEVDDNYGFLDAVLAQVTLGICKETGKIFQFFVVFPVFPVFFTNFYFYLNPAGPPDVIPDAEQPQLKRRALARLMEPYCT